MSLFWVSFGDPNAGTCLGAAVVEAERAEDLLEECANKGCLPYNDGEPVEAYIVEIPDDMRDKVVGPRNRLMSRLEWETYAPTVSVRV